MQNWQFYAYSENLLQRNAQPDNQEGEDDWDGDSRSVACEMNYKDKKAAVKQLQSQRSSMGS